MKLAVTTGAIKGFMARFGDHYCVKNERPSKNVMVFIDDVYQPDTTTDFDVCSKDSPNETPAESSTTGSQTATFGN